MVTLPEGIMAAALFGGILALEKSSMQMLLSEPLFICSAAGAFMGDLESGLMIGMLWQIIWMFDLPVGAVKLPDGSTGALISCFLFINLKGEFPHLQHLLFGLSIIAGGASAYLGGQFISDKRKVHALYIDLVDNFADKGSLSGLDFVLVVGLVEQFASGAFITSFLYFIFWNIFGWILPVIPAYWDGLLKFMPAALWGISSAVLLRLSWNRITFPATILGAVIGAWILGLL